MNFLEKLQVEMDNKGIKNPHELALKVEIPYTTIKGWFDKGYENMRYPQLKKLSVFFGCSMEYLATDNVENRLYYGMQQSNNLTDGEDELLKLYRNATQKGKDMALGVLISNQKEEKDSSKKGA